MTAHACPPLSPCLSCLDDVLLATVLRDRENDEPQGEEEE